VSTINEKLGLRRAGKRSMMKGLPVNKAEAAKITSAKCPKCGDRRANLSKVKGREGWLWCTVCGTSWNPA